MFCYNCGCKVNGGEMFCSGCGAGLQDSGVQDSGSRIQDVGQIPIEEGSLARQGGSAAASRGGLGRSPIGGVFQGLICVGIAVFMYCFVFLDNAVLVQTRVGDAANSEFTLFHVIKSLISGRESYNPTVSSIVMGMSVLMLVFGAASFWALSAAACFVGKAQRGMRRMAVVFSHLALGAVCALPYLAYETVPHFKYIYAREVNLHIGDVKGVEATNVFIWSGIIVALIIAVCVIAANLKGGLKSIKKSEVV